MKFRLFVDFDVAEFMTALSRPDQRALRKRFLEMQDFPTRYVDYHEYDNVGHRIEISICGRLAIKFWIDHLDKHIKVLEVKLADSAP
jgi:hypothetical protein